LNFAEPLPLHAPAGKWPGGTGLAVHPVAVL
jgi:hypothetical protein